MTATGQPKLSFKLIAPPQPRNREPDIIPLVDLYALDADGQLRLAHGPSLPELESELSASNYSFYQDEDLETVPVYSAFNLL